MFRVIWFDLGENGCLYFLYFTAWVSSVAFTPDGETLASADTEGTVKLWDASIGEQ